MSADQRVITFNTDNQDLANVLSVNNVTGTNDVIVANSQRIRTSSSTDADRFHINFDSPGLGVDAIEIARTGNINGGYIKVDENRLQFFHKDGAGSNNSAFSIENNNTYQFRGATMPTLVFDNSSGNLGNLTANVSDTDKTWTLPDQSGTIALLSDVQASDVLSEVLANGNTTGGNDIVVQSGDELIVNTGGFIAFQAGDVKLTGGSNTAVFLDQSANEEFEINPDARTLSMDGLGNTSTLNMSSSASRTWTLPDVSGTISVVESATSVATAIDFITETIFGTFASPITATLTSVETNAKLGVVQKIYHQATSFTAPSGWVLVGSGVYDVVNVNIIFAEYSASGRVEYWITQDA